MLRSCCRASRQPATAALASMDLILEAIAQCGDNCPRRHRYIDGRAQYDRVHAEGITGAYVVLQERLKRAKQARWCPMSCLPQARVWWHPKHGSMRFEEGEKKTCLIEASESICKEARPLSHRLVDAGKWFANLSGETRMRK
jgi:hypothetical protein